MFVDYYAVLEIPITSTKAEIRSAYKTQAIKWHPDKNHGMDTTTRMQQVNEAYLILNDDEARVRFDIEYARYYSQQQQRTSNSEYSKYHDYDKNKGRREQRNDAEPGKTKEEFSKFQIDDEILKKWIENARKQAIRNVHAMIVEFRDSTTLGFGTFLSGALLAILKVLGIAAFSAIIGFILSVT